MGELLQPVPLCRTATSTPLKNCLVKMLFLHALLLFAGPMMSTAQGLPALCTTIPDKEEACTGNSGNINCQTGGPSSCVGGRQCFDYQTGIKCKKICAENTPAKFVCGTAEDDEENLLYSCDLPLGGAREAIYCDQGCDKDSQPNKCNPPPSFCESNGDGFHKKTDDPKGIILCKEGKETAYECPDGTEFNKDTRDCQRADKPEYPSCTAPGLHAVHADCKKYSECVTTKDGFVQRYLECGDDEMFNEETQQCSNPCSWNNPVFRCSEQGRFADPMDCGQYVTCVDIGPQTFKRYVSSCPPGYHFNPDKGRCESTSTYSTCKAKTPTKCDTSTCG